MVPTFMRYICAHARMRDAPAAVLGLSDLGEALVGLQRVAAGRDEIDRGVEIGARQAA
jgi:hypothetical protein